MATETQMALDVRMCKVRGCAEPVVGHSTTGEGHVCKSHNEREWGRALLRSKDRDFRTLGSQLLADASAPTPNPKEQSGG